jgi:hypothetical protein
MFRLWASGLWHHVVWLGCYPVSRSPHLTWGQKTWSFWNFVFFFWRGGLDYWMKDKWTNPKNQLLYCFARTCQNLPCYYFVTSSNWDLRTSITCRISSINSHVPQMFHGLYLKNLLKWEPNFITATVQNLWQIMAKCTQPPRKEDSLMLDSCDCLFSVITVLISTIHNQRICLWVHLRCIFLSTWKRVAPLSVGLDSSSDFLPDEPGSFWFVVVRHHSFWILIFWVATLCSHAGVISV